MSPVRLFLLLAPVFSFPVSAPDPLWAAKPGTIAQLPVAACESEAHHGGGQAGCFWSASINLGPMPAQLYWHIDRFSDAAAAEAARSLYGRVTVGLGGQVFLQTVSDNPTWTASGGERLATVGPLLVPSGVDLVARFMELTLPPGGSVAAQLPSGPQGMFVLGGSLCVETPAGARDVGPHGSAVVPAGVPAARAARAGTTQSLALVVHPSSLGWTGAPSDWTPSGRCL